MTYTIPSTEPIRIVAGATVKWTRDVPEYQPADGWVLAYAFKRAGSAATAVTCTDNGDGTHLATIDAATTAAMAADVYAWQARVTRSGEVHFLDSGRLIVETNLATAVATHDPRSAVKKILDALEARVQGRITADQENLSIDGISISRIPIAEAARLYREYSSLYSDEVNEERRRRGLPVAGAPKVRF